MDKLTHLTPLKRKKIKAGALYTNSLFKDEGAQTNMGKDE